MEKIIRRVREASLELAALSSEQKNQALDTYIQVLKEKKQLLLEANARDLSEQKGKISASLYQRLELSEVKIQVLIQGLREVQQLPDPVGQCTLEHWIKEDLVLQRVTTPIGVIGIIFESRPDAAIQISSLLLKSGNGGLLKGGSEACHSNQAIAEILRELTQRCPFLPHSWIEFIETRQDVAEMLSYHQEINLVIPRGSNQLVQTVMNSTKIPVLGHADGICHLYVDENCDFKQAIKIIVNAKTQYPSACNALETLLVHKNLFAKVKQELKKNHPEVELIENPVSWSIEYSENKLAIKSVASSEEAINHINTYGSHHTDGILTTNKGLAETFLKKVDSSSVFVNSSTRLADGFQYGFGAEVGISTNKTHARGPLGLEGLVIYKYLLRCESGSASGLRN